MYEDSFGLKQNPFLMSPDPDCLYLTDMHQEALAGLVYAIEARKGFLVLTGNAGTGKTTLLNRAITRLKARTSVVFTPTMNPDEFLEYMMYDFGMSDVPESKAQRLIRLQRFLLDTEAKGLPAVLVIDESQRLSWPVLEEVRLLTNLETAKGKLLQIVLAGQEELNEKLNRPETRQLKQRVSVRLSLHELTIDEVEGYLRFRWEHAGGTDLPFKESAIKALAAHSRGIPRVINSLCDNALLLAFAGSDEQVRLEHIEEAACDLDLAEWTGNHPTNKHRASPFLDPEADGDIQTETTSTASLETLPTLRRYLRSEGRRDS